MQVAVNEVKKMGLTVQVGPLATAIEDGPEYAEGCRESLADINEVLDENGLPQHDEPEQRRRLIHVRQPLAWRTLPYTTFVDSMCMPRMIRIGFRHLRLMAKIQVKTQM